jgi:hypothetical protein
MEMMNFTLTTLILVTLYARPYSNPPARDTVESRRTSESTNANLIAKFSSLNLICDLVVLNDVLNNIIIVDLLSRDEILKTYESSRADYDFDFKLRSLTVLSSVTNNGQTFLNSPVLDTSLRLKITEVRDGGMSSSEITTSHPVMEGVGVDYFQEENVEVKSSFKCRLESVVRP